MQVLYTGLIQTTPGLNPRPSLLQGVTPSTLCVCPRHGAGDGLLHPAGRVFLRPVAQRLLRFGLSRLQAPRWDQHPSGPFPVSQGPGRAGSGLQAPFPEAAAAAGLPRGPAGMEGWWQWHGSQNEEPPRQRAHHTGISSPHSRGWKESCPQRRLWRGFLCVWRTEPSLGIAALPGGA